MKVKPIKSVAIVSKNTDKFASKFSIKIAKTFETYGISAHLVAPLRSKKFNRIDSIADLKKERIDALIVVGGDGTILKSARQINDETPILGINVGGTGLMAEISPDDVDEAIKRLKRKKYFIDRRIRIHASSSSQTFPPALNEIYSGKVTGIRTPIYLIEVGLGGRLMQKMDGLIISTPTGSTGHSLSLGSPIIVDQMDVMLITPIASISRMPPIVTPMFEITVTSSMKSSIIIDGQIAVKVDADEPIRISRHKSRTSFIRFSTSQLRQLIRFGF